MLTTLASRSGAARRLALAARAWRHSGSGSGASAALAAAVAVSAAAATYRVRDDCQEPRAVRAIVSPLQQLLLQPHIGHCDSAELSPFEFSSLSAQFAIQRWHSLGSGNYGSVHRGVDRASGQEVAIKQVPRDKTSEEAILDETSILTAAKHKNIIQLRGVFSDQQSWFIVMELAQGGELYERLVQHGMLSEKQAASVMRQLTEAVVYLHGQSIVHGDIKPENMLVVEAQTAPATNSSANTPTAAAEQPLTVKLADFGSAFRLKSNSNSSSSSDNSHSSSSCSARRDYTAAYSPPEVIAGTQDMSKASDVWALGIVMYILCTGRHPYDASGESTEAEIQAAVVSVEPDFETGWENVSVEAKELVKQALSKAPELRPTADDMLAHPWVQGMKLQQQQQQQEEQQSEETVTAGCAAAGDSELAAFVVAAVTPEAAAAAAADSVISSSAVRS